MDVPVVLARRGRAPRVAPLVRSSRFRQYGTQVLDAVEIDDRKASIGRPRIFEERSPCLELSLTFIEREPEQVLREEVGDEPRTG